MKPLFLPGHGETGLIGSMNTFFNDSIILSFQFHGLTMSQTGVIRVVAAVIQRNGSYLVCERPADKRHGGLWEFPGGKLELGETLEDAVRRELVEELGVVAHPAGTVLYSIQDPGSAFVIEFLPVEIEGEPQCLEHAALAWVKVCDLLAMDLAPSDRRFVEFLQGQAPQHD